MRSLPELVACVPSGGAYVRFERGCVSYLGGPYPSRDHACESAGRLVCDVPDVTSISILGRPEMVTGGSAEGWYARATFHADGYTAVVGPFASSRQARSELMDVAGRGQIGTWDEWTVDYHLVVGVCPSGRSRLTKRERPSRSDRPRPPAAASAQAPPRWTSNADRIARWIVAGGRPDTSRDDLLRDIVVLWDEWPADEVVWDVLATTLATIAASPRSPAGPGGLANALLELAAAIEDRAGRGPGTEEDVRRLACLLRPPGTGAPDA